MGFDENLSFLYGHVWNVMLKLIEIKLLISRFKEF